MIIRDRDHTGQSLSPAPRNLHPALAKRPLVLPHLDPTGLAQFVRLESCERFLWHRLHPRETRGLLEQWSVTEQPLTPLLSARGAQREVACHRALADRGHRVVDLRRGSPDDTLRHLRAGQAVTLVEAHVRGNLGQFTCGGRADVVQIRPAGPGMVDLHVIDIKASRKDRVEHRLQVAIYCELLDQMARGLGLAANLKASIWRIPDQGADDPIPFELLPYSEAVRLLVEPQGVAHRMAGAPRQEAAIHLAGRCDGCLYNALCMRDAAETRSLSLVPFLSAPEKKVLAEHGVTRVEDLAALKDPPAGGQADAPLRVAPDLAALSATWPLGMHLDAHVQRARAVARKRDRSVEARSWIEGSGFGSLPDRQAHPGLVQVFVEAWWDYLEDRVYLLSALVVGPAATREVVRMAQAPPGHDEEGALLQDWVTSVFLALAECASGDAACIHFYLYDRQGQGALLDSLARHLERLGALPSFHDLLTRSPALEQAMVSFLAEEVRQRQNLGLLGHSLPLVALRLGFDWSFEGWDLRQEFRARVFDNHRQLPDGTWYESAARFSSQVPLEYAYGAWNRLPPPEQDRRRVLEPFRRATREGLLAFARARLQALAHVEGALRVKNRFLAKVPISLALPGREAPPKGLPRLLEEFLCLEHHARHQTLTLLYQQPLDRRVASGESLCLEALHAVSGNVWRFRIRFDRFGFDPDAFLRAMNPREGSWMVLNPELTTRPGDLVKGRLAVVQSIRGDRIDLDLLPITLHGLPLCHGHDADLTPTPGEFYALDPSADDIVAGRLVEACRNARDNHLLRRFEAADTSALARPDGYREAATRLLEVLKDSPAIPTPTVPQARVIAEAMDLPVLLVQGPPGTGKTHTLAWAILARLHAAATCGRPCRVLVTAMTHTAVALVLQTLMARLTDLRNASHVAESLKGLLVAREGGSRESLPEGCVPYEKAWARSDLAVVGAVPGGVHRLLKGDRRQVDWSLKLFDLLVFDEASQVSLPAAVLAGAALRPDGQAILVGDPRQMPPILAHDWERERRPGLQASAFEAFRDKGFPVVGLDRSFRLHRLHADFLRRHVYAEDQIPFHSLQDHLLPLARGATGMIAAALDPQHPVVVIEHSEARSLKYNQTEIAILTPLLAALEGMGLDGVDGVGVVVPHRAQKAALQAAFPRLAEAGAIDTVERFQGGERDAILVSATASDPDFVRAEAAFLLNPNRLNVGLSRSRRKLVVVASTTLFRLTPPDLETFERALLWKRLRHEFSTDLLWEGEMAGARVRVMGRRVEAPAGEQTTGRRVEAEAPTTASLVVAATQPPPPTGPMASAACPLPVAGAPSGQVPLPIAAGAGLSPWPCLLLGVALCGALWWGHQREMERLRTSAPPEGTVALAGQVRNLRTTAGNGQRVTLKTGHGSRTLLLSPRLGVVEPPLRQGDQVTVVAIPRAFREKSFLLPLTRAHLQVVDDGAPDVAVSPVAEVVGLPPGTKVAVQARVDRLWTFVSRKGHINLKFVLDDGTAQVECIMFEGAATPVDRRRLESGGGCGSRAGSTATTASLP